MDKEPLPEGSWWKILRFWIGLACALALALVLLGLLVPFCSIKNAQQLSCVQQAHSIALALRQYADDNNGVYPTGKSSTEVFQKLIDGGYVTDPSVFYFRGSRRNGQSNSHVYLSNKLKTEYVSFDLTTPVDSSTPDMLPVVFLTGFQVDYHPGGSATHLVPVRNWTQWANGETTWEPFMAEATKGVSATKTLANENGVIPNFIPAGIDLKGKSYQQLTP